MQSIARNDEFEGLKLRLFLGILATLFFILPVEAKPARCFNSDDGYYRCNFQAIEGDGSFDISATNRPTFTLMMSERGVAYGFADYGTGRNVSLPESYVRSRKDPACWLNAATKTKICAW